MFSDQKKEFYKRASNGEGQIFVRTYTLSDPSAAAVILHDLNSYGERYAKLASTLNEAGINVIVPDITGHGLSKQGHPGAFAMKYGGISSFCKDVHELFEFCEEGLNTLPHILISDGFSNLISEMYMSEYDDVDAAVLMSPLAPPDGMTTLILTARNHVMRKGYSSVSPAMLNLVEPPSQIGAGEVNKYYWVSSDPDEVKAYIDDEGCGIPLTASAYVELLESAKKVSSKGWADKIPNIPILILSGADDIRGDYSKAARTKAGQLWDNDHDYVDLKIYANCQHDLMHERNSGEIISEIMEWIVRKALK